MRLPPMVAIVCLLSVSAYAEPITYEFTATLTTHRWNMRVGISPDDEAFWFPAHIEGAPFAASGTLSYDPDLIDDWRYGYDIATVNFDEYVMTINGDLGFSLTDEGVTFVASFPTFIAGLPCVDPPATGEICLFSDGSGFVGEDAVVSFTPQGLTFGSIFAWGMGVHLIDGFVTRTGIQWAGTIDSVTRVPEPATLSLLLLSLPVLKRRH